MSLFCKVAVLDGKNQKLKSELKRSHERNKNAAAEVMYLLVSILFHKNLFQHKEIVNLVLFRVLGLNYFQKKTCKDLIMVVTKTRNQK